MEGKSDYRCYQTDGLPDERTLQKFISIAKRDDCTIRLEAYSRKVGKWIIVTITGRTTLSSIYTAVENYFYLNAVTHANMDKWYWMQNKSFEGKNHEKVFV